MKLDPVYLIQPRRTLSRRQFVALTSTAIASTAGVAFFSGFLAARGGPTKKVDLLDPLVAWAEHLAADPSSKALDELIRHPHGLRYALQAAPQSTSLWLGWARVAKRLPDLPAEQAAELASALLEAHLGKPDSPGLPETACLLPLLQRYAR